MITLDSLSDDTLSFLYEILIALGVVLPVLIIGFGSAQSMHKEQQNGWKR